MEQGILVWGEITFDIPLRQLRSLLNAGGSSPKMPPPYINRLTISFSRKKYLPSWIRIYPE
jgi:hypothetical protein